jgi:CheY-like chemotaxis protein
MITSEDFEHELQAALAHLDDPDHQPSEALCAAMGCNSQGGWLAVESTILRAIEELRPTPNTPPSARTRQLYDLLHNRFVLKLTQEETAHRMHVSRTSVYRIQRRAVHTLARAFWRRTSTQPTATVAGAPEEDAQGPAKGVPDVQAPDWRSQVQRELASLRAKAPDTVADVEEAIRGILELVDALTEEFGVHLEVRSVQPGLVAATHPVLIRQILILAVKRLAGYAVDGRIAVYARLEDGNVRITLSSAVVVEDGLSEADLVDDIPGLGDVSVQAHLNGTQAFVWIGAPSVGKVTVLVVDDNEDMARFYRDCTKRTSYQIVHLAEGSALFEAVEAAAPDIIVLDVMLPDMDGWQLLMRLREDRSTRPIPVIVSTVIREEGLALSLGAARFLAKPVRRREFIEALDQCSPQAVAAASISPTSYEVRH